MLAHKNFHSSSLSYVVSFAFRWCSFITSIMIHYILSQPLYLYAWMGGIYNIGSLHMAACALITRGPTSSIPRFIWTALVISRYRDLHNPEGYFWQVLYNHAPRCFLWWPMKVELSPTQIQFTRKLLPQQPFGRSVETTPFTLRHRSRPRTCLFKSHPSWSTLPTPVCWNDISRSMNLFFPAWL